MFRVNTRVKRKPEYPYMGQKRGDGIITNVRSGEYKKPIYFIIWDNGDSFELKCDDLERFYTPDLSFPNRIWEQLLNASL